MGDFLYGQCMAFLWDYLKKFKYFQAVRLQQDKEVKRWLIFSVSQAVRAVSEK